MKIFTKATLLSLAVAVLCALLAVVSFADARESIVILVGETVNPDTGTPYTLEEAWAEAEEYGKEYTEVVLMTDNASYTESLALVNQEGKKTTLRLCENTSTLNNLIVLKGCELTIDVSGHSLTVLHQIGIRSGASLTVLTSAEGGKVLSDMDYAPFVFASNSHLTLGGEAFSLSVRAKKLFQKTEGGATAKCINVHFDTTPLTLAEAQTVDVELGEGCTLDMNGAGGIGDYGNALCAQNIRIPEGYVLSRTEEEDTFAILKADEVVTLTFVLEGEPITVYYQKGAPVHAPTITGEGVTVNGNYYRLEYDREIQERALEDATYVMAYTGGAQLSGSYTLNTAIDFHAYILATDEITHINGIAVSKLDTEFAGGERYYKITFPYFAPKDALNSQQVILTVDLGEKTVTVERYISLIGYAESAIENKLDQEIIDLILQTLDYVNKANIYFGGEGSERIEELLSENGFTPYVWQAQNVKEIGTFQNLRGACLDLNQTPGFVFYVRAEYEGELEVNGTVYREFSDPVMKGGEMLKYVVVEIPAYRMTDDITVVAGEDTLLYNLDTYIATVASAEPYAHALYGYVVACKNYLA